MDKRQKVWNKSGGHCWYCGCKLPAKGWHADHVEPVYRNIRHPEINKMFDDEAMQKPHNDTMSNMVPACAPCNLFKSVLGLEDFRQEIQCQVERARNYSVNFRTAERFGLIEEKIKPVVFWFEKPSEVSE